MRPGSLYSTFGSKNGLFQEALEVYAARMADELRLHLHQHPSFTRGLKGYLRRLALSSSRDAVVPARACMIVKTLLEVGHQESALQHWVNATLEGIEIRLAAIFEEARACGEINSGADCRRLARLYQSQIMGLRCFAQREVPAEHVQQLAEDMAGLLDLYSLLPPSERL